MFLSRGCTEVAFLPLQPSNSSLKLRSVQLTVMRKETMSPHFRQKQLLIFRPSTFKFMKCQKIVKNKNVHQKFLRVMWSEITVCLFWVYSTQTKLLVSCGIAVTQLIIVIDQSIDQSINKLFGNTIDKDVSILWCLIRPSCRLFCKSVWWSSSVYKSDYYGNNKQECRMKCNAEDGSLDGKENNKSIKYKNASLSLKCVKSLSFHFAFAQKELKEGKDRFMHKTY